uniref:Uncharacterized protein n=1 Tax=Panagrolaimus superbus TaxID=310955 RepID=A0A914YWZ0_9BILA
MVHSFFIGHSYSDRKIKIFPYAMHGEYDDRYDLQSTANAYMHRSKFGMSGPGLNGAHLDFLGWLPMDRMLLFGRDGRQNYTLRLSSLSVPHNDTKGWLLIMIPYDRNDPRNLFTIELRTPNRFDKGISQPSVLIHRIQKAGGSYYSVLLSQSRDFYELTEGTEWVTFLEPDISGAFQTVRVSVRKMYASDADITISSSFDPEICRLGELRKMVLATNYGVNYVCIPRMQNHMGIREADLQRQYFYRNFYALRATYGANECKTGYVWRAIDEYDYVCVPPHRQENAQQQALYHIDRIQMITTATNSSNSTLDSETRKKSAEILKDDPTLSESECLSPYIPRNAFLGDNICVTEREQYLTEKENESAVNLLKYYEFFNGVDTVGP